MFATTTGRKAMKTLAIVTAFALCAFATDARLSGHQRNRARATGSTAAPTAIR
jgi:hypothetical protein